MTHKHLLVDIVSEHSGATAGLFCTAVNRATDAGADCPTAVDWLREPRTWCPRFAFYARPSFGLVAKPGDTENKGDSIEI